MTKLETLLKCLPDAPFKEQLTAEIKRSQAEVEELKQARQICPTCSMKIDEAAGVDVAALNRRIAELKSALEQCRDLARDKFDVMFIEGALHDSR
jgi:uncharacterized protein YPO0396